MTERERLLLLGKDITPGTADEVAIKTAIDNAGSGGGSSLPEPGNVGNVLTSTGEAWESAVLPKETVIVSGALTMNGDVIEVSNLSQSAQDVRAYVNAGKFVFLRAMSAGDIDKVLVEAAFSYGVDGVVIYSGVAVDTLSGNKLEIIVVQPDAGSIIVYTINTPIPSAAANGKILGVDNGKYALVDPTALSNAPLIVHGTISGSDFSLTDCTVKDVYDAKTAGRAVFLDDGDGYRWELTAAAYDSGSSLYSISFGCLKHGMTKIVAAIIGITGAASTTTGGGVIESDLTPNV